MSHTLFEGDSSYSIDSWREGGDSKNWRAAAQGWKYVWEALVRDSSNELFYEALKNVSQRVKGVPCLQDDAGVLSALCSSAEPPQREVRARNIAVAVYGFGDALGGDSAAPSLGVRGSGTDMGCGGQTCRVDHPTTVSCVTWS